MRVFLLPQSSAGSLWPLVTWSIIRARCCVSHFHFIPLPLLLHHRGSQWRCRSVVVSAIEIINHRKKRKEKKEAQQKVVTMRWDLFFRCVFITSGFACLFLWCLLEQKVNRKKRKKRHFKKFNRIVSFLFLETCYCRWSAQSWGWGVGVGGWIDVQKLFLRGRAALCDAFYESLYFFFFNYLLPVFENRWPAFLLLPSIGRRLTLCLQPPAVDTIWSLGSLTCYFRKQIKKSGKAVMALVTSRWCGKETKAVLSTEFHNIGEVINHLKKINVVNIILHFSS